MQPNEPEFFTSSTLAARARRSLAGGVTSGHRRSERPVPLTIRRAEGAHIEDVDGNRYVDFICGSGPIILGHADPEISAAVANAARGIQQVDGQSEAELQLAELLCDTVPSFDVVRLSVSGSEAVHATVRLARAVTQRRLAVKFAGHYHGWLDSIFTAVSSCTKGPESEGQSESSLADVAVLQWNDASGLKAFFAERGDAVAALIMEPYQCNNGVVPPEPGFLELAREETARAGALLIFDEVITGFRLALGGAQARFGVQPDLTTVAKAMGNGYPISAFGGRRELMELVAENRVVHAGTYNGGGISVAAALATIGALAERDPYPALHARGVRLRDGLVHIAERHGHRLVAQGTGPVFFTWFLNDGAVRTQSDHLRADRAAYAVFAEELLRKGVRASPGGRWFLCAEHTDADVDATLAAADEVLSSRFTSATS